MNSPYRPILHRYTQFLGLSTFLLIIAGGLVTSTGSGLAVPDWPLSYGQWMPPMVGGIRFEHSHRMIAASVGFLTLILTIWMIVAEPRRWLRWLTIGALGAVVLQGILGGLTVMYLLPAPISIFHACLAQTFFAFIVAIAYIQSKEWSRGSVIQADVTRLKRIVLSTIAMIYIQLILGAMIRHTGIKAIVIPHIFFALAVLVHAVLILVRALPLKVKAISGPAILIALIALAQVSLGVGAFFYRMMLAAGTQPSLERVLFVTGHQTTGAVLLAASVFFALRLFRLTVPGRAS